MEFLSLQRKWPRCRCFSEKNIFWASFFKKNIFFVYFPLYKSKKRQQLFSIMRVLFSNFAHALIKLNFSDFLDTPMIHMNLRKWNLIHCTALKFSLIIQKDMETFHHLWKYEQKSKVNGKWMWKTVIVHYYEKSLNNIKRDAWFWICNKD